MPTTAKIMKPNARWFQVQLESRGITQRRLAQTLNLDPSAVSLMLHGKRRLQLDEATELARLLDVPLEEVLANAGVPLHEVGSENTLTIRGWIDGDLAIHMEPPSGPRHAPQPIFGGGDVAVLRYQTAGSRFEGLDGSLVYYRLQRGVSGDAIGRFCVVELPGPQWILRVVKRGYQAGSYNLTWLNSDLLKEANTAIESASPVVWMKF